MIGKSSCWDTRALAALSTMALLLLFISAPASEASDLEANIYGEIGGKEVAMEPTAPEVTVGPAAGKTVEIESEPSEPKGFGEGEAEDPGEIVMEPEASEPTISEAAVYVFNRDDDTLSVSLFIDSQLKMTEDVAKDKEKKFANYPLESGPHSFAITWWDDDTKKTHREETVATIDGVTAVTLYTARNTGPEKFDVNVMLRNDNSEDLEAYLYINGEYERLKTAKKESTTDFGKFSIDEGTHILAVRWLDPATKIEYENRKTVRVEGKSAVTFYAPKGMTFETEARTNNPRTATSSTAAAPSMRTATTEDGGEEISSQTLAKGPSSDSGGVKPASETAKPEALEKAETRLQERDGPEGGSPDGRRVTLYLSTVGAILVIYIIFFRR